MCIAARDSGAPAEHHRHEKRTCDHQLQSPGGSRAGGSVVQGMENSSEANLLTAVYCV